MFHDDHGDRFTVELRSLEAVREFLVVGWRMRRGVGASQIQWKAELQWALEIVAEGHALPPLGFVADLGQLASRSGRHDVGRSDGLPASLQRGYEDYVLGPLAGDTGIERAASAIRRLQGRDRIRGVAYLASCISERLRFPGAWISPAHVKSLLTEPPGALPSDAGELVIKMYSDLVAQARLADKWIETDDLFELEHGTALRPLADRVAMRQVLRTAARIGELLPATPPRPVARQDDAPTRFHEDDAYPVGGFASISNRGSIESLLHSQLAYMETASERPDLFDVKFLRDDLLYYSRDENEFYRRRRHFVIALQPDFEAARVKDADAPVQRSILALAAIVAIIDKIVAWLSADALHFDILMPTVGLQPVLIEEERVLRIALGDQLDSGLVRIVSVNGLREIADHVRGLSQRGRTDSLLIGLHFDPSSDPESMSLLRIAEPLPELFGMDLPDRGDSLTNWTELAAGLLARWM